MSLYEFKVDFTQITPTPYPAVEQFPPAVTQTSHVQGGRTKIADDTNAALDPADIENFLIPGFHALDAAMKAYWSDIKIPTKDAYRYMRSKIAGGDKSLQIWHDELRNGRARLPVAAISRNKESWNKDKFSPAYLPMASRFLSRRADRVALVYRPVPFLVEYTILVWAAHKRDAEYAKYQILTRFNPLAEFRMFDGHLQGTITIRGGDSTDQSDKEAEYDKKQLIKHEYTMTAEAWLPLPERVIPTVLGIVAPLRDYNTGLVGAYAMSLSPDLNK